MMHCIEDAQPCLSGGIQDLQHMRNTVIGFRDSLDAAPYLAALRNEVVVRVDHKQGSDPPIVRHHGLSPG
jgi:hypothetical protein